MDTSEMRELLGGYLAELNWAGGLTKDDILGHLAGRDDALRTMVNQYLAEGTYQGPDEVLALIPAQAWQDVQGDAWRGTESQDVGDVDSAFQDSPVGQRTGDAGGAGTAPPSPGVGQSAGAREGAGSGGGTSAFGEEGAPGTGIGQVDPGVSGDDEALRPER